MFICFVHQSDSRLHVTFSKVKRRESSECEKKRKIREIIARNNEGEHEVDNSLGADKKHNEFLERLSNKGMFCTKRYTIYKF